MEQIIKVIVNDNISSDVAITFLEGKYKGKVAFVEEKNLEDEIDEVC